MSTPTSALRDLHRIHRQLTDLRERLDRGPKQARAAEGSVQKMESDLQQTRESAKRMRIHADDKQLQLKEREQRIKDLRGKLNACSSNREYQALKEQIAADEQANGVLADEILEALERLDELASKQKSAESNLLRVKDEAEKITGRVTAEQQMLQEELTRVQNELKQAELMLPFEFRQEYERISKVRGENALAQVDGQSCGGCYQTLTTQTINELFLSRPVFCKTCGCLLYLPDEGLPAVKA
jgi:predicted  nucleic acid-binding Zn-ribbon protein